MSVGLIPGPSSVTLSTTSSPSLRPCMVAPLSPAYLCALSSRLNSTCSSSLSSPRTNGRSGARLTRTGCLGKALRLRSAAPCTTSATSTRSRLTLRLPASMRDMSRRLETKRDSRAVSSSIEARSSSRSAGLILSPSERSDVAAPAMADRGVRRSCEREASSASRTFSFSCMVAAFTASRASSARSSAIAVWSRIAVRARSSSALIGCSGECGSKPQTAIGPRAATSGRNWYPTLGSVPVPHPAGSFFCWAQRAAVIAAASSWASGGQAARIWRSSPSATRSAMRPPKAACRWAAAAQSTSSALEAPESLRE